MNIRITAVATADILGIYLILFAAAFDRPDRYTGFAPCEVETTGSLGGYDTGFSRNPATCVMNSTAEGNANQQNVPVKQYGQTVGGNR